MSRNGGMSRVPAAGRPFAVALRRPIFGSESGAVASLSDCPFSAGKYCSFMTK
jgi:hypothetical protein